jgi:hypothetical protein
MAANTSYAEEKCYPPACLVPTLCVGMQASTLCVGLKYQSQQRKLFMRYLSTLLLATSLTTALAQPSHQDLLYSADITTGKSRIDGGITLEGQFSRHRHQTL